MATCADCGYENGIECFPGQCGFSAGVEDNPIWVICIAHDYGVFAEAGYFRSEKAAKAWIEVNKHEYVDYYAKRLSPVK